MFGSVAVALPGILCGGGMAVCMWMMYRGSRRDGASSASPGCHGSGVMQGSPVGHTQDDQGERIASLEAEVARLNAELGERQPGE